MDFFVLNPQKTLHSLKAFFDQGSTYLPFFIHILNLLIIKLKKQDFRSDSLTQDLQLFHWENTTSNLETS